MSLYIASLNSGSNGNCYYIGNVEEGVLVDIGISCKEVEKRMTALQLDPTRLKAIFITHEHTDHISGLPGFAKKYRIPVYITSATYRGTGFQLNREILQSFTAFVPVKIGSLSVTAFPKRHDAADPHSVIISGNGITVGVFTDIGGTCENVISYFKRCHAIFLESNYDEDMLANGRYPFFLKKRISGGSGHLSNKQALDLFLKHRPVFLKHVLLSHLSRENNDPAIAMALFNQHANGVSIVHAPRDGATGLYHVTSAATDFSIPAVQVNRRKSALRPQLQLKLF